MSETLETAEFRLKRTFNAPRELVWHAFAEAERLAQWWGPKGCAITVHSLDFRPGGLFHYSMAFPGGEPMWGKFVYRDIVEPERLVFVNSFADEAANTVRAPFSATWPLDVLTNIDFTEEEDGRTTLALRGGPLNATEPERRTFASMQASLEQGFGGTFDQLADYLATVQS